MIFENLFSKFPWSIFQGKYGTGQKSRKVTVSSETLTGSSGTLVSMSSSCCRKWWDIEANVPLVGH